jgi:microsomal dipeptidase-like Zn-dependent dipeptidase
MINLIPPTAQKEVKREYWIRVATVWMTLMGVALAAAVVLYIPTYVLIQSQLVSYTEEFEQIHTENQAFTEAKKVLTRSNEIATALGARSTLPSYTAVIDHLENNAGEGIVLLGYDFIADEDTLSKIEVAGTAATRAALTEFSQILQEDEYFSEVDLPLAQLAQDRNIAFTLTLTWANK